MTSFRIAPEQHETDSHCDQPMVCYERFGGGVWWKAYDACGVCGETKHHLLPSILIDKQDAIPARPVSLAAQQKSP